MTWTMRVSTALVLALAIVALPLVLDQCVAACEAHKAPTTDGPQPACHHVTTSTTSLGRVPAPCGHDHDGGAMAIVAANVVTPERGAAACVAVTPVSLGFESHISHPVGLVSSDLNPLAAPDERSLPLRV